MKYKIVTSGTSKVVSLAEISQNLKPSSEIYELSDKEVYLGLISHQTLVLFATEFADYALKNYAKKENPEAEACIRLTRKWLEDRESVSNEELRAAADAAYAAADDAAAYAADAAAGENKNQEYERQGTFILDFLKTGNHLFLV